MKFIRTFSSSFIAVAVLTASAVIATAATPPKQLGAYLEKDKIVKGEIVQLDVPKEFYQFELALKKAKNKDPKWFEGHIKKSGKNSTIPEYHEKLGITKKEYDKYVEIWNQRGYKKIKNGDVQLMLTEVAEGNWVINVSGKLGSSVSLMNYSAKEDTFTSGNGVLKRIADINSPADSIYGAWKGHEWRYFNDTPLIKTKENLAIGRTADTRYGILIYSLQEVSGEGTPLADRLMIIRFIPKKLKK